MIINGDSLEELQKMQDNSVDSIVTDPPYDIGFMGKKWDKNSLITNVDFWKECLRVLKPGGHLLSFGHSRTSHRMVSAIEEAGFEIRDTIMWMYGSGFPKSANVAIAIDKKLGKMGHRGKEFDTGAKAAYGEKRPISGMEQHQAISEEAKEWQGWGTALKPAYEPITMARKPLEEKNVAENVMKWGTGGINIDASRIETGGEDFSKVKGRPITKLTNNRTDEVSLSGPQQQEALRKLQELGRFPANVILDKEAGELLDDQSGPTKASYVRNKTDGARPFNNEGEPTNYTSEKIDVEEDGKGASRYFKSIETELCASLEQQEHKEPQVNVEPITVARKPLEGTVADNAMKWGTGALNIDESRIGTEKIVSHHAPKGTFAGGEEDRGSDKNYYTSTGRFPANVILDQEAGELLDDQSGFSKTTANKNYKHDKTSCDSNTFTSRGTYTPREDEGGASRFFYCPKVSKKERDLGCEELEDKDWSGEGAAIPERENRPFRPSKNNHPTVKPIKLMEYLVKLVTKPGGVVLDPFAGSGSTGVACKNLGMKYILVEREEEYCKIILARLGKTVVED